jgi:hypothetical protein
MAIIDPTHSCGGEKEAIEEVEPWIAYRWVWRGKTGVKMFSWQSPRVSRLFPRPRESATFRPDPEDSLIYR